MRIIECESYRIDIARLRSGFQGAGGRERAPGLTAAPRRSASRDDLDSGSKTSARLGEKSAKGNVRLSEAAFRYETQRQLLVNVEAWAGVFSQCPRGVKPKVVRGA